MSVRTADAALVLTDFIMQIEQSPTAILSRNIRLEARSDRCLCGVPDIQIGRAGKDVWCC